MNARLLLVAGPQGHAEIVATSSDVDLVAEVASRLLTATAVSDDAVLAAIEGGRRAALKELAQHRRQPTLTVLRA